MEAFIPLRPGNGSCEGSPGSLLVMPQQWINSSLWSSRNSSFSILKKKKRNCTTARKNVKKQLFLDAIFWKVSARTEPSDTKRQERFAKRRNGWCGSGWCLSQHMAWGQDRTGQDRGHPARVGGERQHMPHHLARAVLFWGTDITPNCLKSCGWIHENVLTN